MRGEVSHPNGPRSSQSRSIIGATKKAETEEFFSEQSSKLVLIFGENDCKMNTYVGI